MTVVKNVHHVTIPQSVTQPQGQGGQNGYLEKATSFLGSLERQTEEQKQTWPLLTGCRGVSHRTIAQMGSDLSAEDTTQRRLNCESR